MTEFENKTFYTVRELYRFFKDNPEHSVLIKWCEVFNKRICFDNEYMYSNSFGYSHLERTLKKARRENRLKSLKCTDENGRLKKYLYCLDDIYNFLSLEKEKEKLTYVYN